MLRRLLTGLAVVLLLCAALGQYADINETKVSLRLQNADLQSALQALMVQTGAQFVFVPTDKEYAKVNVSLVDQPLDLAVKYICMSAGAAYQVEPGGVFVIRPLGHEEVKEAPVEIAPAVAEVPANPPLTVTKIYTLHQHPKDVLKALVLQDPDSYDNTVEMLNLMWNDELPFNKRSVAPTYAGRQIYGQALPGPILLPDSGNVTTGADRSGAAENFLGAQIGGRGGGFTGAGGQIGGGPGGQIGPGGGGAGAGGQQISGGLIPEGISLVSYDPTDNSIIVQGTEEDIETLRRYITMFDVRPQQVMVKVEFITVTTDRSESFGIDWLYQRVNFSAGNTPGTFAVTNDPIFVNFSSGNVVSRLRTRLINGEGKVVNAPLVTTLNNQPASIFATTTIPLILNQVIVTGTGQVVTAPQLYPIPVSSGLQVAPRVNRDGTITLSVAPQVSEIGQIRRGPNGEEIPDTSQQGVVVTRIIKDGETMVLGGLTRKQNSISYNRFPILGDLPIVGQFFRSRSKIINESELLIFITPSVIPDEDAGGFGGSFGGP